MLAKFIMDSHGKVGIIGGSGLYQMEGLQNVQEVWVETPYGEPSDAFICGRLEGVDLVFLPRHGRGHLLMPSEINYRANIYGLKKLGCDKLLSFSAVGSLREEIAPGHLVIIEQFFDRTRGRQSTFFGQGCVAHVSLSHPVCPSLSEILFESASALSLPVHRGAYLCIEGPQFSTKAESLYYHNALNVDVIGMTNVPEFKLAREAELCYVTVALSTDYDSWNENAEAVTAEKVLETMRRNIEGAKKVLRRALPQVAARGPCHCQSALKNVIVTAHDKIPLETKERLRLFIERYVP